MSRVIVVISWAISNQGLLARVVWQRVGMNLPYPQIANRLQLAVGTAYPRKLEM